jgi:Fic family protein
MVGKRRRIKHSKSFKERLLEEAAKFRDAAEQLPPGFERELLMKRVRQAEAATQFEDWLRSPGAPASKVSGALKKLSRKATKADAAPAPTLTHR